jgi:hypothetical protein
MTLNRQDFLNRAREAKKEYIAILKSEKNRGGVMICRHNSILCIKNTESGLVEFIIDTDKERGCVMISELNRYLAVPRYTPDTAREWLKEPLSFKNSVVTDPDDDFNREWESKRIKVVLSEHELRQELKKELVARYSSNYDMNERMKEAGIEVI